MLSPSYKIESSGTLIPDSRDVSSIVLHLSMDEPIDVFSGSIRFRDKPEQPKVNKDSELTAHLGYDDDLVNVFKGKIDMFQFSYPKLYVHAVSAMSLLTCKRFDRFYEAQTCGAMVKDLCESAGVEVDEISDGIQLPSYALDSNKNAYEHVKYLAQLSGFDAYTTNENKLMFKKFKVKEQHTIEYGKNLIRLNKVEQTSLVNMVKILGESPSSLQGAQTTHWLSKQKVQGAAGDGAKNDLIIEQKVIKDEDTAKQVANAIFESLNSRNTMVIVETLGDPKIRLGDSVTIKGMPFDPMNGEYQVRSVEHYLSKLSGFTTTVKCMGNPRTSL